MDSEKHVISLLVDNRTGVLSRVVGLFGRRGFNIDSLTVSATDHPEVSRITILVHGDAAILRQIILQTDRLEETREVFALESADSLFRELLLYGRFPALSMWATGLIISVVTMLLGVEAENPNDMTIGAMLSGNYYRMMAISAIGAPLVEETLFRGVVFQSLRRKGRVLAYVVSGGLFCLYHVWSYALAEGNALLLLYALQYVPVTLIMTWVYERSGSLWTSVFFHSSYNFLSLFAMRQLQLIS